MTIRPISGLLLAATISLVSCKKEETAEKNTADQKPVPSVYEIVNGTNMPKQPVQPQQNLTVTPTQTTTTVTPPVQPTVAKGMNPAHGQPGHRCDIPVGAPLNSPAAKPATPQGTAKVQKVETPSYTVTPVNTSESGTTTTPNSGTPALISTQTANVTQLGTNPPHGQEGHRCDIAVGAPLPKQ